MAREIGIPQEDLIFLGFPNAGVEGQRSVFMHGRTEPINGVGHKETYGIAIVLDYSNAVLGQSTPTKWIEVHIVDVNGMEAGFSEIELYGLMPKVDGFIQILGNDQFMYDWIVYSREALPQLSLYYWEGVRCRVLTESMDDVCVL